MNHKTDTWTRRIIVGALALVLGVVVAACGSSSHSHGAAASSAAAAASSARAAITAQPAYTTDMTALENELTANFQKHFDPKHPVKSTEAAVRETFPQGDTGKITSYAVKTFTLAVAHTHGPGSARDKWVQGVVTYALAQGGYTPSASATGGATPGISPASSPSSTTGASS
jgi:hypothetical protein